MPVASRCPNCGGAMGGRYCGECGQRVVRGEVSLREFLREGLQEMVNLDSRVFLTLRALFARPGRLTADHLAGRRQRYLSSVQLYLACSVVFFVALAALVPAPDRAAATAIDGDLDKVHFSDRGFDRRFKQGVARVAGDPEAFMQAVWGRASKAAFVLVPVFALLTMAIFRRRVRFFVPHLHFALHLHSFLFLASIPLLAAGRWIDDSIPAWGALVMPGYLIAAARTTFQTGWGEAAWKSLLVSFVYAALLLTVVVAVIVSTILV